MNAQIMNLPFFFHRALQQADDHIVLDEPASKHIIQVLRMQEGEELQLTNGAGLLCTARITDANRKRCAVALVDKTMQPAPARLVTIAISPLKNNSRFEWFLEKATELGVHQIIPIICERTEKQHLKMEHLYSILESAMLQSQQAWMPVLDAAEKFKNVVEAAAKTGQHFIAHCEADEQKIHLAQHVGIASQRMMLIGPEGDFSPAEIALAKQKNFVPVSLGDTRLRTETAGLFAATILCAL